jgi:hypothetical protein
LLQYSRACDYYQDSFDRRLLLTRKQLNHGVLVEKLKSSHQKGFTVSPNGMDAMNSHKTNFEGMSIIYLAEHEV